MSDLQCPATVILAAPAFAAERPGLAAVYPLDAGDGRALRERIDELSDLHRGETILVVAAAEVIREALGRAAPPVRPVTVSIDSEGWTVVSAQEVGHEHEQQADQGDQHRDGREQP